MTVPFESFIPVMPSVPVSSVPVVSSMPVSLVALPRSSNSDMVIMPPEPPPVQELDEVEPNDTLETAENTGISAPDNLFFFASAFSGNNPNVAANLDVDFYKVQLGANEQLVVNIDTASAYPPPMPMPLARPMLRGGADTTDSDTAVPDETAPDATAPDSKPQLSRPIYPPPMDWLDLTLRLFDETGKELAIVYDAPAPGESYSSDPYLEYIIDTPGTYYIGVSNLGNVTYDPTQPGSGNNYGDSSGNYTISISRVVPPQIKGTTGEDSLEGTTGFDLLDGLAGDDIIQALAGDDRISGGTGNDLVLAGNGADRAEGNEGNDRLFGEEGDDILYGNIGNDFLNGGEGFDTLWGGKGQDKLEGGSSDDKLNGEEDNDTLVGGAGNDLLEGGDGNDILTGISTSDAFSAYGLYEADTLTGGKGKDLFVLGDRDRIYYDDGDPLFDNTYSAATITDFDATADRIQLKGSAELYALDFYRTASGSTSAALLYDAGIDSRAETIAILENVSPSLKLTSGAFLFV